MSVSGWRGLLALLPALLLPLFTTARAHDSAMHDDKGVELALEHIELPEGRLMNQNGQFVSLRDDIAPGHRLVLTFQYTTCEQLCGIGNLLFQELQNALNLPEFTDVRLVSITLDPETDTPEVLAEASRKFDATERWIWITGTRQELIPVYRSLGAGLGPKEQHSLFFLVGKGVDGSFVRISGTPSTSQFLEALRNANP